MNRMFHALLGLTCMMLAGACRTPNQANLLQHELRVYEDKIFQLQAYTEQYRALLDACRRENESLRGIRGSSSSTKPDAQNNGAQTPGDGVTIPRVEPGVEGPPPASKIDLRPAPGDAGHPGQANSPSVLFRNVSDPRIAAITLNRVMTGGVNIDGAPGDDGIIVVLEARNAAGQIVPPEGDLAVALLDPAASRKSTARVARWDIPADQLPGLVRASALGDGIHLELLWPDARPRNPDLHLYVRLTTPAGLKLMADSLIDVEIPGLPSTRRARTSAARRTYVDPNEAGDEATTGRARLISSIPDATEAAPLSAIEIANWSKRTRAKPRPIEVTPPAKPIATAAEPRASEAEPELAIEEEARRKPRRPVRRKRPTWSPYR